MNIKELAGQANERFELFWPGGAIWYWEELAIFAELVAAHEREECIRECYEVAEFQGDAHDCAAAIRARSKA